MSPLTMLTGASVAQVYHPFYFLVEPTARWVPNAAPQPRPEAAAERRLEGVG